MKDEVDVIIEHYCGGNCHPDPIREAAEKDHSLEMSISEIKGAMNSWAEQQAIAFAEFINKYALKWFGKWEVYGTNKHSYTTEELYQLFLKSQSNEK